MRSLQPRIPRSPLRNISAIARRKRSLGITLGEDRTENTSDALTSGF